MSECRPQLGWNGRREHTICDDEGKIADTTVCCIGTPDGLEVDGDVVKQDEKATTQAWWVMSQSSDTLNPHRSSARLTRS